MENQAEKKKKSEGNGPSIHQLIARLIYTVQCLVNVLKEILNHFATLQYLQHIETNDVSYHYFIYRYVHGSRESLP